jgi:hypothetical protein
MTKQPALLRQEPPTQVFRAAVSSAEDEVGSDVDFFGGGVEVGFDGGRELGCELIGWEVACFHFFNFAKDLCVLLF